MQQDTVMNQRLIRLLTTLLLGVVLGCNAWDRYQLHQKDEKIHYLETGIKVYQAKYEETVKANLNYKDLINSYREYEDRQQLEIILQSARLGGEQEQLKLPSRKAICGNYKNGCWIHVSNIQLRTNDMTYWLDSKARVYKASAPTYDDADVKETERMNSQGYVYLQCCLPKEGDYNIGVDQSTGIYIDYKPIWADKRWIHISRIE